MAPEQQDTEVVEEPEAEQATLDPEVAARRAAALAHVRKFGDPVLKAEARPVEIFDQRLLDEVARMGAIMHDSLGIGLAATQVGVLNRVLVYRVEHDSPVNALVNPVVEWSGSDKEVLEEGCLSLPGVHVDVERPIYVRVRAQDATGEPIVIEASGLEARVIQHEIDHLDGVLILDRTSRDQRKEAMRALRERLEASGAEAAVVCAFGALIKEPLLSRLDMLNVHPSLLPRWRGAAPVERAIMAGDDETGVSIMRVTAGLDSGPVCLAEAEPIRPDDDYGTLAARLEELGARLLVRVLDERPPCVEQDEAGATYAEKIGAADRTLDPDAPAAINERVVRALHPHIGVRRARVADDGSLELLEVQPPGGRPMAYADYLRGHARA